MAPTMKPQDTPPPFQRTPPFRPTVLEAAATPKPGHDTSGRTAGSPVIHVGEGFLPKEKACVTRLAASLSLSWEPNISCAKATL